MLPSFFFTASVAAELYRVFTGFQVVLPGFRWFYRVLLGFTEFYWVLSSFTGFLLGFSRFFCTSLKEFDGIECGCKKKPIGMNGFAGFRLLSFSNE